VFFLDKRYFLWVFSIEGLTNDIKTMKRILLWCSPGFGVVDMWLPVVRKLKERGDVKIDFVFPEPSSLRLESKNSDLFRISMTFADNVIYRGYSGRWFTAPTLNKAHAGIKFNKIDEKIAKLSQRLSKGRLSNIFILRIIGRFISVIFKCIFYIKETFINVKPFDVELFKNTNGILCDIVVEGKSVNKELKNKIKNIPKFSMFHGLNALWVAPSFNCKNTVKKRSDVVVFSMSRLELEGYERCFGILKENIVRVGIPRHDRDWIKFVTDNFHSSEEIAFESFVFVIGRPASQYNTADRKKKALIDVYNIVCKRHKLKLVVKSHPKESLNSIDGQIYSDAFGMENYGKTWVYSDKHPFVLGQKAIFSVSFYSGVGTDMLAINKPTIEYLDLSNLSLYDNNNSLSDCDGEPVFELRYVGLVLGASTKEKFSQHVDSILNQRTKTISSLHSKYKEYYEPLECASKVVASNIYNKI